VELEVVRRDLQRIKAYVNAVAAKSVAQAPAIIVGAGMSVKASSGHAKAAFKVMRGRVSGSVRIFAKAAAKRASYEWQYAIEGGPWQNAEPTLRADTTIDGLEVGKFYSFRMRARTKAGLGDWTDPVRILVV